MVEQKLDIQEFDVAAAITAFLSDQSLTALELPGSLSAEQRRQAKKLADQHEGLKCESFGFGAERRLNLFKHGLGAACGGRLPEAVKGAVRVKNTFIDDFVGLDGSQEGGAEPLHCRSLPNRFNNGPVWESTSQDAAQMPVAAAKSAASQDELASSHGRSPAPSTSCSCGSTSAGGESPCILDLPELPAGFKFTVRDTFIHIEEEPVVERCTQSMPDGVFLRCLQAELEGRRAKPAGEEPAAPVPQAVPPVEAVLAAPVHAAPDHLFVGTEVTIEGLMKLPIFNGLTGTIDSYDAETGRYNVLLDAPSAGSRWAKVRGENLRQRVPPPPPHHAPMLMVDDCAGLLGPVVPPTPTWEDSWSPVHCGIPMSR